MKEAAFSIDSLLGSSIECTCGRTHRVTTRKVLIGKGVLAQTPNVIRELGLGENILLVCDPTSRKVAGDTLCEMLVKSGMKARIHTLRSGELHADEQAIGSLLIALDPDIDLLIAVGSGTIGDITRFVAFRTGVPYVTCGTAPSMDGFASSVSPLLRDGFKITYEAVPAEAIIGDTDILREAPMPMLAAGFGDILGKMTALCDWQLSDILGEEDFCPYLAGLVRQALDKCLQAADGMAEREDAAVECLMEALVLSGLAIQLMGNSRPASGSEHHLAHFFEMKDIFEGRPARLHGDKVGVATILIARVYEKLFSGDVPTQQERQPYDEWEANVRRVLAPIADQLIAKYARPTDEDWQKEYDRLAANWEKLQQLAEPLALLREKGEQWLRAAQGPATPADLGYGREELYDSLCYAKEIRPRFTILTLLDRLGILKTIAREVADASECI